MFPDESGEIIGERPPASRELIGKSPWDHAAARDEPRAMTAYREFECVIEIAESTPPPSLNEDLRTPRSEQSGDDNI